MSEIQAAKALARAFHSALSTSDEPIEDILGRHLSPNHIWRGFDPFNELVGPEILAKTFWSPICKSLSSLQRREDIFFAGTNEIDTHQSTWVASMGHLVGLFDAPFLGIPATGKMAFLRYAEFLKIENNTITETSMFLDIPHLMAQAGVPVFGNQAAAELVQPGPMTHAGLLYAPQDASEGVATLKLLNKMIANLGQWQGGLPIEEELRLTWTENMIWWGPTGIGSTYTIERYAKQHAGPFRASFSDRSGTGHIARLAEGQYAGFFGWPNFTARPTGGYLGLPPSSKRAEFRVIDIYRRSEDKLAENWVFIDLLHFCKSQGRDMLKEALARI